MAHPLNYIGYRDNNGLKYQPTRIEHSLRLGSMSDAEAIVKECLKDPIFSIYSVYAIHESDNKFYVKIY